MICQQSATTDADRWIIFRWSALLRDREELEGTFVWSAAEFPLLLYFDGAVSKTLLIGLSNAYRGNKWVDCSAESHYRDQSTSNYSVFELWGRRLASNGLGVGGGYKLKSYQSLNPAVLNRVLTSTLTVFAVSVHERGLREMENVDASDYSQIYTDNCIILLAKFVK